MSLASDAAYAPDRTSTAEILSAPQGPARSPLQSTSFPAVSTTSLWLKTPAESQDGVRDLRATVTATNVDPLLVASWPLDTAWRRLSARVVASGAQPASFGVSQTPDWPIAGLPALSTDPFYAWGAQLEAGRFPTSYVPSEAASGSRAADVLTFANPPAWLQSGTWQFEASPLYASDEMLPRSKYVLVAIGSSAEVSLIPADATQARLEIKHQGGTTASTPFTFRVVHFCASPSTQSQIECAWKERLSRAIPSPCRGYPSRAVRFVSAEASRGATRRSQQSACFAVCRRRRRPARQTLPAPAAMVFGSHTSNVIPH
jgi:hypothetical protein